ncbi:MAG: hypothetical protein ACR2GQ_04250, partial [Gemmatimonadota bacterium]
MGYTVGRDARNTQDTQDSREAPYARLIREQAASPYDATSVAPEEPPDPDALQDLGDEIATLAAHVSAAQQRLLGLIARFDRHGGWKPGGHRTCAHWLVLHAGYDLHVARERTRVAEALAELPETAAAMARGALSLCKVRALSRVATPANEADLLELAEGCTAPVLSRRCRAYKTASRKDEAARERALHESRRLSLYPNGEGMYRLDGLLTPETAAVVGKSLDRAVFALYGKARAAGEPWDDSVVEASRRRADALGMVAEWALGGGSGADADTDTDSDSDPDADADADTGSGAATRARISGTRADRWQIMLHVEPATLEEGGEPGMSELEDGTRISAETARRLSCDAAVVRVTKDPADGSVLDVGRKSRSTPTALRRALEVRDRGCRFPGCGLRYTDSHHIFHWIDGGPTSLKNTVLLCRVHHRLVHEG